MLFWKGWCYGGVLIVFRGVVSKLFLELWFMNDRIIYCLKISYGCMLVIECCIFINEDRDEEKIV